MTLRLGVLFVVNTLKRRHVLIFAALTAACADETAPADPMGHGLYQPAHTTLVLEDADRERSLTVEVWYPGQGEAVVPSSVARFERDEDGKALVADLLQAAQPGCPSLMTQANQNAEAMAGLGARPLLVFSHCYNCGRYSSFSLAERLASHGMIVVAPDHAGVTPFAQSQDGESLDAEQLEIRVGDLRAVLSASIDGSLFAQSRLLDGLSVDSDRIGGYGHSFGAATIGRLAQVDSRIQAAAALAAPMASFLFPAIQMDMINVPLLFVLAKEDNSITEIGNDLLRSNVAEAVSPVWLLELADAGHWSVSDLCGLVPEFEAGCGQGQRHSRGREGEPFDYIPVRQGIETTQAYLGAFFRGKLSQDSAALNILESATSGELLDWRVP